MAICECCNQDMLTADGCKMTLFIYEDGRKERRIPFGKETRYGPEPIEWDRCTDCNVKVGECHHPGCDWEECPICGGQLISCSCEPPTEGGWYE